MSKEDQDHADALKLCAAMNGLTGTIYSKWADLSERHLSIDDLNRLASDLKACINQMRQFSVRLEAEAASSN